jgi:hypothetical protein
VKETALRLTFAFLVNESSSELFAELSQDLMPLLSANHEPVAELAACCLTSIVSHSPKDFAKEEAVANFLNRSLTASVSMQLVGLRLAGVVSSTYHGAAYLDENGVVQKIAKLLDAADVAVQKMATMVFASVSVSYPMAASAPDVVPSFFNRLDDKSLAPYPLIAIANLAVNPSAAAFAAKHIAKLVGCLKSADAADLPRVLTAIHRIVITPESHQNLTDDKALSELIGVTEPYWEHDYSSIVFDILDYISGVPGCRKAIIASGLQRYLHAQLRDMVLADSRRPLLMRILSRIGNR